VGGAVLEPVVRLDFDDAAAAARADRVLANEPCAKDRPSGERRGLRELVPDQLS
jgi:hypothetical protein